MSKIQVIVVDDSESMLQQVRVALEAAGLGMIEARDGLEGLAQIRDHKTAKLVISDLNMPKMNGLEMLQALKTEGGHDHLPIIVLTTEADVELVNQARAAGARAWITKPFKPELLIAVVKKLIAGA